MSASLDIFPPALPVRPIVFIPMALARTVAYKIFWLFPDVDIPKTHHLGDRIRKAAAHIRLNYLRHSSKQ